MATLVDLLHHYSRISRKLEWAFSASSLQRPRPFREVWRIRNTRLWRYSTLRYRLAVGCRRHMPKPTKMAIEVREICQSDFTGDHANGVVGFHKSHAGPSNPEPAKIFADTLSHMPYEKPMQGTCGQITDFTELIDANVFTKSLVQVIEDARQLCRFSFVGEPHTAHVG